METSGKSRVIMLAVSGLLFGATAFGWWVHESQKMAEPTEVAAINQPVVAGGTTQLTSAAPSEASVDAPVIASAPSLPQVYPSTSMEDAVRAARASIKKDPTRPMSLWARGGSDRSEQVTASRQASRSRAIHIPPPPNTGLIDPPAVYPVEGDNRLPAPQEFAQERTATRLGIEDVNLVGIIDGKAIFRVRHRVAEELALPRSFTLGKGESFGDLRLQSVGKEMATVQDGNKVATKSLDPVH